MILNVLSPRTGPTAEVCVGHQRWVWVAGHRDGAYDVADPRTLFRVHRSRLWRSGISRLAIGSRYSRPAMTDEELLLQWRDGNERAGEKLFERHFDALFRFFCSKLPAAVAEDLTQETFLACVKGKDRFRFDAKFRTYMYVVARRELHGYYDKRRKSDVDLGSMSAVDLAPGAATAVAAKEEEQLFLQALRRLPVDYQIAIELHNWEGMTGPEIAEVLAVPEGTVRSRLRRARIQLEELVRELSTSPQVLESTLTNLDDWAKKVREAMPKLPKDSPASPA